MSDNQRGYIYIDDGNVRHNEDAVRARYNRLMSLYGSGTENTLRMRLVAAQASAANSGDPDEPPSGDPAEPTKDSKPSGDDPAKPPKDPKPPSSKAFKTNVAKASATGARASASANASVANVSAATASATGASAHASANVTGANVSAGNVNATGASASANVSARAANVAVGNANVTGAETYATASATGANMAVGNVSVSGVSAGASATATGTGVKAFNVAVSGPSASVNVSMSGEASFGNVVIGIKPTICIAPPGLNIGIPFMGAGTSSGGSGQGGGQGGQEGQGGAQGGDQAGGQAGGQGSQGGGGIFQSLAERFPNRTYYIGSNGVETTISHRKEMNIETKKNTSKEPVNTIEKEGKATCDSCEQCDQAAQNHEEMVGDGNKFVGFRGTQSEVEQRIREAAAAGNGQTNSSEAPPTGAGAEEKLWAGKYTTDDPDVAAGYTSVRNQPPAPIEAAYIPGDSSDIYYTNMPLDQKEAEFLLKEVKQDTNNNYVFGGPQGSEMKQSEFVVSPSLVPNVTQVPSAHQSDGRRLHSYHEPELAARQIVPDYFINKGNECQRIVDFNPPRNDDPWRERPKDKKKPDDLSSKEQLDRLEDSLKKQKLTGANPSNNSPPSGASRKGGSASSLVNQNSVTSSSQFEPKEEEEVGPKEPCKDHSPRVTCFKCLNGGSGKKIKKLGGGESRIFGFDQS